MDLSLKPGLALELFSVDTTTRLEIPIFPEGISAGFPSPALDFEDLKIDLNKYLIRNPSATFFGRVKGDSLKNAGIDDGDLMVIDRSARPLHNKIAVVFLDGEFTAKRIQKKGSEVWLIPENEAYQPIKVNPENQFLVWGIVTYVIKSF